MDLQLELLCMHVLMVFDRKGQEDRRSQDGTGKGQSPFQTLVGLSCTQLMLYFVGCLS